MFVLDCDLGSMKLKIPSFQGKNDLEAISIIARQSTHILHIPSFLGTSRIGTAHGLMLSLTYPLPRVLQLAFEAPLSPWGCFYMRAY